MECREATNSKAGNGLGNQGQEGGTDCRWRNAVVGKSVKSGCSWVRRRAIRKCCGLESGGRLPSRDRRTEVTEVPGSLGIGRNVWRGGDVRRGCRGGIALLDRKSTRLNSSHVAISYAVFCLKKKKKNKHETATY